MAKEEGKARRLTAVDRKQLSDITKNRFEILNGELNSRRSMIRSEIEKQVMAEYKADIDSTRKDLVKWKEEREKTTQRINELEKAVEAKRTAIIEGAKERGLKVQKPSFGTEIEEIQPENLGEKVKQRMDSLLNDYNSAKINLKTLELETLEKISVAGLESIEAQEFMGEIPDLDKLLPPVSDIKQLISGSGK